MAENSSPSKIPKEDAATLRALAEEFRRTANFHLNLAKTYAKELVAALTRKKEELFAWEQHGLDALFAAGSNYYENYALYLKNKVAAHQQYHRLFSQKHNLIANSCAAGRLDTETVLAQVNAVVADAASSTENQLDSLQVVVDTLFVEYDQLKERFRQRSPEERRAELENMLERLVVASVALESQNQNVRTENSLYYHVREDAVYQQFERFLTDTRYTEGVFVQRWLSLVAARNAPERAAAWPRAEKQQGDFYEKLVNETVRVLKAQYGLRMELPTGLRHGDVYFNALQLAIERFYFDRLYAQIFALFDTPDNLRNNQRFTANCVLLRKLLAAKNQKLLEIDPKLGNATTFRESILWLEKAGHAKAPTDIVYCFVHAVRKLHAVLSQDNKVLSADVIFPYVVFCLAHSNLGQIHQLLQYLEYVAEKDMQSGEVGVCSSMIHAASLYITNYET